MSAFTASDHEYMARALRLARRGEFSAHPNPRVGCVLVRDGRIVGEGWHRRTGEPHAEVNALRDAGEDARGASAYVTLEPCAHHGRTPPCASALIDAGVSRVIAAMEDPHPKVAGKGMAMLAAAGVDTAVGLLRDGAEALNRGFVTRVVRNRPFVTLKVAASLDGRTAMESGDSRWITGEAARRDVQRLRAASGAVLTGVGTVVSDDPALTVRGDFDIARQPLRAVVDSRLRMPADARLLGEPGTTLVYCIDDAARAPLEQAGADVQKIAAAGDRPALAEVLAGLAEREVNDVLAECGPLLAGSLLDAGLVDELVIYLAPHIMGSDTRGMFDTPSWTALTDRLALEVVDVRQCGPDLRITATPGP